jgi:membrane protease YdiL (CAAX protease family)
LNITSSPTEQSSSRLAKVVFGRNALLSVCLAYLVALGGAEYLSQFVSGAGGILVYIVILFGLIIFAALSGHPDQRGVWIALGLAPLIRIISLALPVMLEISQVLWYIVVSIPILVAVITVARSLKFGSEDIGLAWNKPLYQFAVIIIALGLAVVDYLVLKPAAWSTSLSLQNTLFPGIVLLVFTGFVEELAFRGVMQKALAGLGDYWWMYVAAVYAVLQIGQGSVWHCLVAFGMSLIFGWVVKRSGSIFGVSIAHGLINIGLFLVLPHLF